MRAYTDFFYAGAQRERERKKLEDPFTEKHSASFRSWWLSIKQAQERAGRRSPRQPRGLLQVGPGFAYAVARAVEPHAGGLGRRLGGRRGAVLGLQAEDKVGGSL